MVLICSACAHLKHDVVAHSFSKTCNFTDVNQDVININFVYTKLNTDYYFFWSVVIT